MCTENRKDDNLKKYLESMDKVTIEQEVKRLLDEADEKFSEVEAFISEYGDAYEGNLAEFVFRSAIRAGKAQYVEDHVYDFELNDGDGCSTYLYETDDESIQAILMDYGAFKSWDDYGECRFAMESVEGEILAFDPDFQEEVFEKYKETYELTDERIVEIISNGIDDDESERDVEYDLQVMGISVNDGKFDFKDLSGDNGYDFMELIEELGWNCDFEGDSWKFETLGVYFISCDDDNETD